MTQATDAFIRGARHRYEDVKIANTILDELESEFKISDTPGTYSAKHYHETRASNLLAMLQLIETELATNSDS